MKKFLIYAGAFTFTGIAAYIVENQEKINDKLDEKYKFNKRKEKLNSYAGKAQNTFNVLNKYDLNNLKATDYLNIISALFVAQTAIQNDEQNDNKDNSSDNLSVSEENSDLSSINTFKNENNSVEDKQDDRTFHVADGFTSDNHNRHDNSYHDNNFYDDSSSYSSGSSSYDSGSSSSFDSGSSFDGGSSF